MPFHVTFCRLLGVPTLLNVLLETQSFCSCRRVGHLLLVEAATQNRNVEKEHREETIGEQTRGDSWGPTIPSFRGERKGKQKKIWFARFFLLKFLLRVMLLNRPSSQLLGIHLQYQSQRVAVIDGFEGLPSARRAFLVERRRRFNA